MIIRTLGRVLPRWGMSIFTFNLLTGKCIFELSEHYKFDNKSQLYSNFKQVSVVQNSFPIVEKLTKINNKNNT